MSTWLYSIRDKLDGWATAFEFSQAISQTQPQAIKNYKILIKFQ